MVNTILKKTGENWVEYRNPDSDIIINLTIDETDSEVEMFVECDKLNIKKKYFQPNLETAENFSKRILEKFEILKRAEEDIFSELV